MVEFVRCAIYICLFFEIYIGTRRYIGRMSAWYIFGVYRHVQFLYISERVHIVAFVCPKPCAADFNGER